MAGGKVEQRCDTDGPLEQKYYDAAVGLYHREGAVEVDDAALVSIGVDGAYVQAWVFVPKEEVETEEAATAEASN